MKAYLSAITLLGFFTGGCAVTSEDADVIDDSSEAVTEAPFVCDQSAIHTDRPNLPFAQVKAVRSGSHAGYERWVMEFEGSTLPNYRVEREESARFFVNGLGAPVTLEGNAGMSIGVHQASGFDANAQRATFTGPKRIQAGGKNLREAALLGDFQGEVGWGLGMKRAACFRVTELASPPRLVVDVQTNGPDPAPIEEPAPSGLEFECANRTIAEESPHASFASVAAVRVGAHNAYDRFVMEFGADDQVPSFNVSKSAKGLDVAVFPASGTDPTTGVKTYKGYSAYAGGATLTKAGIAKDKDGRVTWGLDVRATASGCYRAYKLESPSRLVVDVKH